MGRSKFPFWVSMNVFALCSSFVIWFKYGILLGLLVSGLSLLMTVGYWISIVMMEGLAGNHLYHIQSGIKMAFGLFILSEFMFFFGIFWTFFDAALSPAMEIGCHWPPMGIIPINPMGIPLFNTIVLLSSGVTATYAHWLLRSKHSPVLMLFMTLVLAFFFEMAQYIEYSTATFSISDGIYGSIFYFGTGFHGLHVIMGHIFLFVNLLRSYWAHFTRLRHLSLEMALIYWHFVDVVWLALYVCFYWWGY